MQDHATANDSGTSRSTWMDVEVPLYGDELPRGLVVDVCVIGAGIAGLSTAYHLARDGANVALAPRAAISATMSAAEKSRFAVPPA